jgi:hypothetical protein
MRLARDVEIARPPPAKSPAQSRSTLELMVLLLLCIMTWALSHVYRGLFHDAGLYALQALARLSPASLSQDVFLHYGSQDRYTIFSPIYTAISQVVGTEAAAATLTCTFQVTLFVCAWLVARAVMPARLSLYGLAVLIAIPGDYGAGRIFACVEPFLTPRMGAEALVLASLAAALSARPWLATALVVCASLMHPIMASAGIATLLCLNMAVPHARQVIRLFAIAIVAFAAAMFATPNGVWSRFDPSWLRLVMNRSPYLFLSSWQIDDWARVAVTVATLSIGLVTVPTERARVLCRAALLTTAGGLVLTFIACDELHLIIFTQLQPWRWQWLGTVIAALILPLILSTQWGMGVSGRTTVLLLAATWTFGSNIYAMAAAPAALASIAFTRRLTSSEARLVFWGACGMLTIAIIWREASNLEFTDAHYFNTELPLWLRRAMSFAHDGSAPMAVIALAWWLANATRRRLGQILLAAVATAGCLALLPQTWSQWTKREYSSQRLAQFAPWRERIPPGADVFWPESPVATWLLLNRPNYLSVLQTSGMVFSRNTAVELERRALALTAIVPPGTFLSWNGAGSNLELSLQQLQGACQLAAFEFLVTRTDLGVAPVGIVPQKSPAGSRDLRLYRCPMRAS